MKRSLIIGTLLVATVTAYALCIYTLAEPCHVGSTTTYECPGGSAQYEKRVYESNGNSVNNCAYMGYSGYNDCVNDGGLTPCIWDRTITYCDDSNDDGLQGADVQPRRGGGSPCG